MFHSHPLDPAYGNPGYFVDRPAGKVRDSAGRLVDLRPDTSERNARRILVRTSELPSADGVFRAKIRPARNVSAVKLSYASVPRPITRVTAQLILYSINIKSDDNEKRRALHRFCRNQLLSTDTSDYPFFRMTTDEFDWRGTGEGANATPAVETWINSFDKNTRIPPSLEHTHTNQYVDVDILTASVPSTCSLHSLGQAFSNALRSHSGASNSRRNSLWSHFDISVEETGFSVLENVNDTDPFTTFASVVSADMLRHDLAPVGFLQKGSARDTVRPLGLPLTITLAKSRSVFVPKDSLKSASASVKVGVSTSSTLMQEIAASASPDGEDTFQVTIPAPTTQSDSGAAVVVVGESVVYSFSFLNDMSIDDILEVKSKYLVVELYPKESVIDRSGAPAQLNITLTNDNLDDLQGNNSVQMFHGATSKTQLDGVTIEKNGDQSFTLQISRQDFDEALELGDFSNRSNNPDFVSSDGVKFLLFVETPTAVDVSEVKRSYQKQRDVRLGLRWGDKEEDRDFFIDKNHSFESEMVHLPEGGPARKDVAHMAASGEVGWEVDHNELRSVTDLQDTYVPPRSTMSELYNVQQHNDAHQLQRMLFGGHMMNVLEPTAMENVNDYKAKESRGKRPYTTSELEDLSSSSSPLPTTFFKEGLGWETSIVHRATRWVMPAFPVRFTEDAGLYNGAFPDSNNPPSTSVSPLVARILSTTETPSAAKKVGRPYYKFRALEGSNDVDDVLHGNMISASTDADGGGDTNGGGGGGGDSGQKRYLTYYERRDVNSENAGPIVVTIGSQNYAVQTARLVSLLRNETDFTLELSCDRNKRRYGYDTANENQNPIVLPPGAFHEFFARKTQDEEETTEASTDARYFAWVYELDRPVELPTGIAGAGNAYVPNSTSYPAVTRRTFHGLADRAAMFVPGEYEHLTGRPAVNVAQQSAHNFFVRSGTQEPEHSLLVLHGLGSVERPINSSESRTPGDVFAVMRPESDLKKTEGMACEHTVFLRTPENLDQLDFHFMSSKTGKKLDIENQGATLVFDLYCSNE